MSRSFALESLLASKAGELPQKAALTRWDEPLAWYVPGAEVGLGFQPPPRYRDFRRRALGGGICPSILHAPSGAVADPHSGGHRVAWSRLLLSSCSAVVSRLVRATAKVALGALYVLLLHCGHVAIGNRCVASRRRTRRNRDRALNPVPQAKAHSYAIAYLVANVSPSTIADNGITYFSSACSNATLHTNDPAPKPFALATAPDADGKDKCIRYCTTGNAGTGRQPQVYTTKGKLNERKLSVRHGNNNSDRS